MTITRLFQTGAEFGDEAYEWSSVTTTNNVAIVSTTKSKTGTYSYKTGRVGGSDSGYYDWAHSTTIAQFRMGFHINHNGSDGATDDPEIAQFLSGTTEIITILYSVTAGQIQVRSGNAGGTILASTSSATFDSTDTWFHIGIDCKIAVSGWCYVYLDGSAIISFSGDTTGAGSSVDKFRIGYTVFGDQWTSACYYDDIFVENTTGEVAAAQVPDYRFELLRPDGNGYSSQWTGSDADSTDNYLLVDETPPDGDTTYVEEDTTAQIDAYTLGAATVPSTFSVNAAIPVVIAKKLDAGGTVDLNLGTRLSSTNSTGASGPALTTDYQMVWTRQTTKPGGGSWTESDLNSAEGLLETS